MEHTIVSAHIIGKNTDFSHKFLHRLAFSIQNYPQFASSEIKSELNPGVQMTSDVSYFWIAYICHENLSNDSVKYDIEYM